MKKESKGRFLFWLVNFSYTIFGCFIYIIFTFIIALLLSDINNGYKETIVFEKDSNIYAIMFCLFLLYLLIKIIIFPILYICKNRFCYAKKFLNELRSNNKLLWRVLSIVFFIDLMGNLCLINDWNIFYLGLGLLPSYLIFLLLFPPVKINNTNEEESIITKQGKPQKILTITLFGIVSILFLLVIILLFGIIFYT